MIFQEIPSILKPLFSLCRCDAGLLPGAGLEPITEAGEFCWKSTAVDPSFGIRLWRPLFGWGIARVRLAHDFAESPAVRLYFDSEKGLGEANVLQLIPVANKEYQGLVFLESRVKRARLNFGDRKGRFSIEKFELYNVPRLFVRRYGLRALSMHHRDFRGAPKRKVLNVLRAQSRIAGKALDEILNEKIQSLIEPYERGDYATWIQEVENPYRKAQMERYESSGEANCYEPLISIILPVFDPPEAFLRKCLDSVIAQTYVSWELCIADDASSLPHVRQVLEEYKQKQKNIRVAYRTSNGGISAASNTALDMVRGDYVALLDHDDTLAENALSSVIEALQRKPRPKILYSDEDKIDTEDRRYSPHFKSDWNPDLLYSQNYVSHLVVYDTRIVRSIAGFTEGFEGSQDHDLLLRASARVHERHIYHIPLVLYHWRASEGSTAGRAMSKLYAWGAGVRVLQSFFEAQGKAVRVARGRVPFTYQCTWSLPETPPLVSIIIPTRDNLQLFVACISSVLEKTKYPNFEILVIDNDSQDNSTIDYLAQLSENEKVCVLKYPGTFNFSAVNNFAAIRANGDLLCLLNDDIEVIEPEWLTEMTSHACRPEIGCVGAKLIYPDGRIQHAGVICGICGVAGHSHKYFSQEEAGYFSRLLLTQNVSAVTAACLVVRRDVWRTLGGMNSTELPIAFNDVDFCLRVRRLGLRNLWTPKALLTHHESASRGPEIGNHNKRRLLREANYMQATWGEYLKRDPYYSPHLTLKHEDFSIRAVTVCP